MDDRYMLILFDVTGEKFSIEYIKDMDFFGVKQLGDTLIEKDERINSYMVCQVLFIRNRESETPKN